MVEKLKMRTFLYFVMNSVFIKKFLHLLFLNEIKLLRSNSPKFSSLVASINEWDFRIKILVSTTKYTNEYPKQNRICKKIQLFYKAWFPKPKVTLLNIITTHTKKKQIQFWKQFIFVTVRIVVSSKDYRHTLASFVMP